MPPEELERRCLLERDGLLVFDKPPDLPTSGRTLADPDCLQTQLIQHRGRMLWALHQLDADTSGLNLFVSEKRLVQSWKAQMAWPRCEKSYLAILHGNPELDSLRVEAPIGLLAGSSPASLGVEPSGRAACTRFKVLARGAEHHLARIVLETGRTHQIRIHAAHLGHALVGEEWYRRPACKLHPRQALHAHRLRISEGPKALCLEAALPADLIELAAKLGLGLPTDL